HLVAFVLIGTGLGLSSVNAIAMGVRDSADEESGLLSGLVNAAQQLGGAVGLAALAGIAIGSVGAAGEVSFTTAFLGEVALVLIALALSLLPPGGRRRIPVMVARSAPPVTSRALTSLARSTLMTTSPLITGLGATGTIGTDLVPRLLATGTTVRAVTRDPARRIPGAQRVIADLRDPGTLRPALAGADALFLNSPSSEDAAAQQIWAADL